MYTSCENEAYRLYSNRSFALDKDNSLILTYISFFPQDLPKVALNGNPLPSWQKALDNIKSIKESTRTLKVYCDRPDHLNQSLITLPERFLFPRVLKLFYVTEINRFFFNIQSHYCEYR